MKRLLTLLVWLGLVLASAVVTRADGWTPPEDGFHLGWGFSQESISKATGLNGGSYLNLQSTFGLSPQFAVNVNYATDIAPNQGSDQLLELAAQFNIERDKENYYYLALCYLTNLSRKEAGNYLGLKYSPYYSGRTGNGNPKIELSMFPVGLFYNFQTREYMMTFEMMKVGIYFN